VTVPPFSEVGGPHEVEILPPPTNEMLTFVGAEVREVVVVVVTFIVVVVACVVVVVTCVVVTGWPLDTDVVVVGCRFGRVVEVVVTG
jgi:hypothetical protein